MKSSTTQINVVNIQQNDTQEPTNSMPMKNNQPTLHINKITYLLTSFWGHIVLFLWESDLLQQWVR